MSRSVMSVGFMAPLSRKITKEEYQEWSEILYEKGSSVHISYEGDIAYTERETDEYGIYFPSILSPDPNAFDDLNQFEISVEKDKIRSYRCFWYDGTDSDMDMMTKETFLEMTNQEA